MLKVQVKIFHSHKWGLNNINELNKPARKQSYFLFIDSKKSNLIPIS